MLNTKKNDFIEMGLHHLVTIYLLGGSYILNLWECGTVIAYLHDLSDVPGMVVKIFSNTVYNKVSVVCFFITIATWMWVRNYAFTDIIYILAVTDGPEGVGPFHKNIFLALLTCLAILHLYWVHLFFKILWKYIKKGETEDL